MIRLCAVVAVVAGCSGNPPPPANPQPPVEPPAPAPAQPPVEAPPPAAPHAEIGDYGFDKTGMDTSADPATSFFAYANGNWQKLHPMPDDKSYWGNFIMLEDRSVERTKGILEQAKDKQIADYYRSFMDEKAIEAKGTEPLRPLLAEIDALQSTTDVVKELARFSRLGLRTPLRADVEQDDKDPEHYIGDIWQSGLGLPDRDYYDTMKAQFAPQRDGYKKYLVDILTLVGIDETKGVTKRAAAVYALEEQLAKVHWTSAQSRDPVAIYNKITTADLGKLAAGIDWKIWLDAIGFGNEKAILLRQKSAIIGTARIIKSTPVAVWKDYLVVRAATDAAPLLSKKLVDTQFDFYGKTLSGTPKNEERWKRGVALTSEALGEAIGKLYVAKYFTPETKAAADKLVKNLLVAMGKHIDGLPWMTEATKTKARAKLASYNPKIGYPSKWRDYAGLEVKAGDVVGNRMRSKEFDWSFALAKLGKPLDRDEWFMTPMTVNAYYNPVLNEVVFPAAILQPPFFDPHADDAINYGGIGAVIGHEISHGFDDSGRQYDDKGALVDWWTKEDAAKFKVYSDKLVAQYNAYCPYPAQGNKPALCVNGSLTLGENIADLAGLTIAYDAYKTALAGKEAPVIDGTTGDQRFFLGFAQVWRLALRDEQNKNNLVSDPHSPPEYRTSVVRNLDAWYEAFKLQPGKGIALPADKRVKIW